MSRAIFFDLDGTLTDSGPGIINCAQLALAHFGIQVPDRDPVSYTHLYFKEVCYHGYG